MKAKNMVGTQKNAGQVNADTLKRTLFSARPGKPHTAWLGPRHPSRGFGKSILYPLGFKMAADELVEHLGEDSEQFHHSDALLYAIFFNYRHYLELRLKRLIQVVRECLGDPASQQQGHDLMSLWHQVRALFERHAAGFFVPECDLIEEYIKVVHDLDADSQAFRYPDAQFALSDDDCRLAGIDLNRLKEHFAELSDLLDRRGLD